MRMYFPVTTLLQHPSSLRQLLDIRDVIFTSDEHRVPKEPSTPLITTYACYVVALFKREHSSMVFELDLQAFNEPITAESPLKNGYKPRSP